MSRQLTESQRFVLAELLRLKLTKTEIAKRLHVHRSTVHRELARNTSPIGYIPEEAQGRAQLRQMLPLLPLPKLQQYLPHLNDAMRAFEINTLLRTGSQSCGSSGGLEQDGVVLGRVLRPCARERHAEQDDGEESLADLFHNAWVAVFFNFNSVMCRFTPGKRE